MPCAAKSTLVLPVPAPISTAGRSPRSAYGRTAAATSCAYPGRAASYCSATSPKTVPGVSGRSAESTLHPVPFFCTLMARARSALGEPEMHRETETEEAYQPPQDLRRYPSRYRGAGHAANQHPGRQRDHRRPVNGPGGDEDSGGRAPGGPSSSTSNCCPWCLARDYTEGAGRSRCVPFTDPFTGTDLRESLCVSSPRCPAARQTRLAGESFRALVTADRPTRCM